MTALGQFSDQAVVVAVVGYLIAAALFWCEFAFGTAWTGRVGYELTWVALASNVLAAVARGQAAGRVPWANMYEYSVMVGVVMAAALLIWIRRRPEVRPLGGFVLTPAVVAMAIGIVALYVQPGPVMPALQSGWIRIHVVAAITGSTILCLSSVFSILYLVAERRERQRRPVVLAGGAQTADPAEVAVALRSQVTSAPGGGERGRSKHLPPARVLDELAYKTAVLGFPIWTFAVIAGAIWAQSAWGRYWGWDPKETWSFITWTIYATYLHARATAGWRGRGAARISVLGLAALLVNFYAVNLWIVGLHSYAGV